MSKQTIATKSHLRNLSPDSYKFKKLYLPIALVILSLISQPLFAKRACESSFKIETGIFESPVNITRQSLDTLVTENRVSWKNIQAGSEQNNPLQIGTKPYQRIVLGQSGSDIVLPAFMKTLASEQFQQVRKALNQEKIELEVWPTENDNGDYTWTIARFRKNSKSHWQWLSSDLKIESKSTAPELPTVYNITDPKDFGYLFTDVLDMPDLYDKPMFANTVFTSTDGRLVYQAWPLTETRELLKEYYTNSPSFAKTVVARFFTQPPRLNEEPVSFSVSVTESGIEFNRAISWDPRKPLPPIRHQFQKVQFPQNFQQQYKTDVKTFAGELTAEFPISKMLATFTRKNNTQAENQLLLMAQYFKERYAMMGLKTFETKFKWRGMDHSNVIAVIPGTNKGADNKPVILADHFDTAYAEDVFEKTGKRVAAPGADDNYTATAALLAAAATLKDSKPKNDIWLLHLTGEEFPADDLGARVFIQYMLENKIQTSGIIIMDMIGHNPDGKKMFQISSGKSDESIRIAELLHQVTGTVAPDRDGKIRDRFSDLSYLYNTDGRVFSAFGFPVVLLNEHLNRKFRLFRDGYHKTSDNSSKIDWNYALDIVRVAITSANALAQK